LVNVDPHLGDPSSRRHVVGHLSSTVRRELSSITTRVD
jgi:hypothetical protein